MRYGCSVQVLHRLPRQVILVLVTQPLDLVHDGAVLVELVLENLLDPVFVFASLLIFLFILRLDFGLRVGFGLALAGGDLLGDIVGGGLVVAERG